MCWANIAFWNEIHCSHVSLALYIVLLISTALFQSLVFIVSCHLVCLEVAACCFERAIKWINGLFNWYISNFHKDTYCYKFSSEDCLCCIPEVDRMCYHFHLSLWSFWLPLRFLGWPNVYSKMYFLLFKYFCGFYSLSYGLFLILLDYGLNGNKELTQFCSSFYAWIIY